MNLNLDFSAVPRFLRGIAGDLRQKKLWPVAAILVAALVAVPVLLAKSSSPTPVAQAPVPTPPPPSTTSLPALNVQTTPAHSRLTGPAHNPFGSGAPASSTTGLPGAASTAVSTASSVASNASSAVTGGSSTGSGSSVGSSGSAGSSPSTSTGAPTSSSGANPPSITPNAHPTPAPSGLAPTQSYGVSLAMTTSSGGVNTIDPLERLSVLPSETNPRLVELGVLQGGKRVLFALQPGTVVVGPGTCTPGPIDCEILSLGQDQTEGVAAIGSPATQTLFAVTGITATNHASAAAANRARRAVSAAGRTLLASWPSSVRSLFPYEPSLGSIVDLRNLTVRGS